MAELRRRAKLRRRRLIYNNDGNEVASAEADTPEGFYAQRMNAVLDSQVDTVFYCTGATVMFSHDAGIGETYGMYPVEGAWGAHVGRNCAELIAQGNDSLSLVSVFCRKHDLELFYTHRINDIHDSMDSGSFELATWKREHPGYCLGRKADQPGLKGSDPRYWWSALNFELTEVRDYLVSIVEDICGRYDIDGYDVDYFRSPMFFEPNLDHKPATDTQVQLLTVFQRRVREAAYREGSRRGRPILVSVRVPMTVEKCRHVGIDIEAWLEEDLFDILVTGGGYVPFTMPTASLVELGHRYDKPVYPTISASGMQDRFQADAAWRGAAANAWSDDADGIMLFNTFPGAPGHPHFTQLGDPGALRYMSKIFAVDTRCTTEGDLAQAIVNDRILPVAIASERPGHAELPVGDDIAAAAGKGVLEQAILHVRYEGDGPLDRTELKLNGRPVDGRAENEAHVEWSLYVPEPSAIRWGDNTLIFKPAAGVAGRVTGIELHVEYR